MARDGGRTDFPNPVVNRRSIRLSIDASKLRQTSENRLLACDCRAVMLHVQRMLIKMYFYCFFLACAMQLVSAVMPCSAAEKPRKWLLEPGP